MGAWGEVIVTFPLIPGKRVHFWQVVPFVRDDGIWTFTGWKGRGLARFSNEQGETISVRVTIQL